jgi:DNA (cytosine-5)-methyltransferase 1
MKHGSLFSGIGGFDLAAEWMGWENVFHCEWNDFGKRVLSYYWPNAISYNDITETDFTIHRGRIDILTGGFPCQPYSAAGKRRGKDDERHLWPQMLRAIREIQPRWVVGENVFGITNWNGGLVFNEVQADLEAEGYEVQAYVLPACAVNAPHRRDRVWFVAHRCGDGCERNQEYAEGQQYIAGRQAFGKFNTHVSPEDAANPDFPGRKERGKAGGRENTTEDTAGVHSGVERPCNDGIAANTDSSERREGRLHETGSENTERHLSARDARSDGRPNWDNFPTQSPVRSRDDGLSVRLDGITFSKWRNESIKAAGNAVVPQVVFEIFKAIEAYERKDKG